MSKINILFTELRKNIGVQIQDTVPVILRDLPSLDRKYELDVTKKKTKRSANLGSQPIAGLPSLYGKYDFCNKKGKRSAKFGYFETFKNYSWTLCSFVTMLRPHPSLYKKQDYPEKTTIYFMDNFSHADII